MKFISSKIAEAMILRESAIMTAMLQTATESKTKVIADAIWIDPARQGGAPCFINTRVPIQNLFDYLEGGDTLEDFLEGFPPVTQEQAEKVLELARTSLFQAILNGENSSRS